jgi:hypothetical protein
MTLAVSFCIAAELIDDSRAVLTDPTILVSRLYAVDCPSKEFDDSVVSSAFVVVLLEQAYVRIKSASYRIQLTFVVNVHSLTLNFDLSIAALLMDFSVNHLNPIQRRS